MEKATRIRLLLIYVCFCCLSIAIYWRAKAGVFTFDTLDWVKRYSELGFSGFMVNFHDVTVRPVIQLFMYIGYACFGLNENAALLSSLLVHAFNALMLVWFIQTFLPKRDGWYLGLLAGLVFLLFPYQTEVVVWGVGNVYLVLLSFFWIMLWGIVRYARTSNNKYLIVHISAFILAFYTHELSIVFPLISLALVLLLLPSEKRKAAIKTELALYAFFIPFYFLVNKWVLGVWVGHYGATAHSTIHFKELETTFVNYCLKFGALANWWPTQRRTQLFALVGNHPHWAVLILLSAAVFLVWFGRKRPCLKQIVFAVFTFALLVGPVLNLYFLPWIPIHGDRLGYLPSAFFIIAIAFLLYNLHRSLALVYLVILLVGSAYFLNLNIASWQTAGKVMHELETTFPEPGNQSIFILAKADNYRGAYMYRCRVDYPFAEALRIKQNRNYIHQTTELLEYSMVNENDSLHVSVIDSLTLKIEFAQWGNWWWRNKLGAVDYQTSTYTVDIDDWSHSYLLHFYKKPQNTLFIYQSGSSWKQVQNF